MQDAFWVLITNISLYPTVLFTAMVLFVTLYWLVSLLGMVDMDAVDIGAVGGDIGDMSGGIGDMSGGMGSDVGGDLNSGSDVHLSSLSATGLFTGLLLRLGLYGVPLIVILTLISLIGWLLSYLYTSFLHQRIDSGVLYYVFGTGAFILVLVVSMWLTGLIIAPIRNNAAKVPKRNAATNIGKIAVVRTLSVTNHHGEALLNDGGAGLILRVRPAESSQPYTLNQGDEVVLVAYLAADNAYQVAPVQK